MWAQELTEASYHMFGIDIVEARIETARSKQGARSRVSGSCSRLTTLRATRSQRNTENGGRRLIRLFRRVYQALVPVGVFVFDGARLGHFPRVATTRGLISEGKVWVVLVEKEEDLAGRR